MKLKCRNKFMKIMLSKYGLHNADIPLVCGIYFQTQLQRDPWKSRELSLHIFAFI